MIALTGSTKIHNYSELLVTMAAIFFSSLVINIIIKRGGTFDYLVFTVEDIKKFMNLPVVSSFLILLFMRIKQVLIVIVMMKIIKPEIIYNALIILLGALYEIIMSVQAYFGGVYYAGVFVVSILPHYIIYIFIIDLIFKFYKGRVFNKNKIRFTTSILMLTMVGVFMEENFLRIFFN